MMPVIISSTHIVLAYGSIIVILVIKWRSDEADIQWGISYMVLEGFFFNVTLRLVL